MTTTPDNHILGCVPCSLMAPGHGCLSHTCADCGVVSAVVCGSPDDPSGGADCRARARAARGGPRLFQPGHVLGSVWR